MRLLPLAFLALILLAALLSPGFFEADEISHFLKAQTFAQYLLHDPDSALKQLLDIWGRPACTGLFGLATLLVPAPYALIAARLTAVAITLLTILGTLRLYQSLQPPTPPTSRPIPHASSWLILLLFAQPLFLMNSFAVMTELLLACSWVWAAALTAKNRILLASLILGLGGLARPEGWFAIAAWPPFLLLWTRYTSPLSASPRPPVPASAPSPLHQSAIGIRQLAIPTTLALTSLLAWYLAGLLAYSNPLWPRDHFPWHAASQYGTTGLFFLGSSLLCLAFWMWIPLLRAIRSLLKKPASSPTAKLPPQNIPTLLLTALPLICFFLLHATLGTFGLMGSMSLPRYFVAIAPFAAILTLLGLPTSAFSPGRSRKILLTLILLPALTLIVFRQLPTSKTTDMRRLDIALAEFQSRVPPSEHSTRLIAGHPYIFYALHLSLDSPAHTRIFDPEKIRTAPRGTYLLTDTKIWLYESRPSPETLQQWGYTPDPTTSQKIDALPPSLDLTTLGYQFGQVRLWIKTREAS